MRSLSTFNDPCDSYKLTPDKDSPEAMKKRGNAVFLKIKISGNES